MTLARLPYSTWAWFITSIIGLIAFSVLLPACVLLLLDRVAGTSFFIPAGLVVSDALQPHSGGSPLLWQHLFWFFGHPEVYIAIVPGFGIISTILPVMCRKPHLGPRVLIACQLAIAGLSYMVWGHHMFLSGMSPTSATLFSVPTLIITIPAAIITLLWLGTIYGSKLRINSAALFCLGFVSVFVTGGLSGFFLSQPSIDTYLHGTYFVVGHFHFVMGVAAMFGIFAGHLFLVSEDVRPDDERDAGQMALCAHVSRGVRHVHADALARSRGERAALLVVPERLHARIARVAPLHHVRGALSGRGAADLPRQPALEQASRSCGSGQSVGGDLARVEHAIASAVRQLRRRASGRVARTERVRRERAREETTSCRRIRLR